MPKLAYPTLCPLVLSFSDSAGGIQARDSGFFCRCVNKHFNPCTHFYPTQLKQDFGAKFPKTPEWLQASLILHCHGKWSRVYRARRCGIVPSSPTSSASSINAALFDREEGGSLTFPSHPHDSSKAIVSTNTVTAPF